MRTRNRFIMLVSFVVIQNLIICQPIFAVTCEDSVSSKWVKAAVNATRAIIPSRSPSRIDVLNGVEGVPPGWTLLLNRQSLPIEIMLQHPIFGGRKYKTGVRIWVDSDLGNANVNLYKGGRVEISLSSVMNEYTADRILSHEDIVRQVSKSSERAAAEIRVLTEAGALEISRNGIVMSTRDQSRSVKQASKRLTQNLIDFLEEIHSDAPINENISPRYAIRNSIQKDMADFIQNTLGIRPRTETKDVWPSSKDLLDPQENRPSFYSSYTAKIKGLGEVTMHLGNGDYSTPGFSWVSFKPIRGSDKLPSEIRVRRVLGNLSKYITKVTTFEDGRLIVDFNTKTDEYPDYRDIVFRIVSTLRDGTLLE